MIRTEWRKGSQEYLTDRDPDAAILIEAEGQDSDLLIEAAAVLIYVARKLAYVHNRSEHRYIDSIMRIAMAEAYDGSKRKTFEEMGVDATTMIRLFGKSSDTC